MERSVSVHSDRNIRIHIWRLSILTEPTEICRSHFKKPVHFSVHCPTSLHLCRELTIGKGITNGRHIPFGCWVLLGNLA